MVLSSVASRLYLEGRLEQPRVEIVLVGKGQRLVRSVHPANGHLEGATGEEAGRQRVEQGVPLDPPGLGVKAPPARLQEVEITRRGHGAPPTVGQWTVDTSAASARIRSYADCSCWCKGPNRVSTSSLKSRNSL